MNIAAAIDELCPHGAQFAQALEEAAARFDINTKLRAGHWLGQLAHESGEFQHVRENLNYSADGLMRTWPIRFPTKTMADAYAHQPVKIANRVYSNRIGNGDEASGDGARFFGRGLLQLTGRSNYHAASLALYDDERLILRPELVEMPEAAALTAGWFWSRNKLNALADQNNTLEITRRINGGTNGLAARELWVEKFMGVL